MGLLKLAAAMGTVSLTALGLLRLRPRRGRLGAHPGRSACCCSCGWCTAMLVIGLLLRFGQSAEILAWATTFMILALSGVFNPVESIPGPIQPIARVLPTTYAFSAARDLLDGDAHPVGRPRLGDARCLRAGRPVDALRAPHAPGLPGSRLRHARTHSGQSATRSRRRAILGGGRRLSTSALRRPALPRGVDGGGPAWRSSWPWRSWPAASPSSLTRGRRPRGGGGRAYDRPRPRSRPPRSTTTTAPPLREGTLSFSRRRPHPLGVWEAADTGGGYDFSPMLAPDRHAADGRRHRGLPPRGTARPPRGPALELPPVPRAPLAGAANLAAAGFDGCSRRRTTRSTSASRAWWRRSTALDEARPRTRRHRPLAEGGRPAARRTRPAASRVAQLSTPTGSTATCSRRARSGSSTRSTRR